MIAQGAESLSQVTEGRAEQLRRKGFSEDDLLMVPTVRFADSSADIEYGLIRLNADTIKVPIQWYARETEDGPLTFREGLAFAAAKVYRRGFPDGGRRLDQLAKSGYHPVTSFLRESDFAISPAEELVCLPATSGCALSGEHRRRLHGRIAVIGFDADRNDLWNTAIGRLPGFVLQANYLESLLDSRVYRPVRLYYQILLSLAWFCLIELPFWRPHFSTGRALLTSCALSGLIMFVLYYVLLVNFTWYVSLAPPSILAILGRISYHALEEKVKLD
jgi:hypothetical protein